MEEIIKQGKEQSKLPNSDGTLDLQIAKEEVESPKEPDVDSGITGTVVFILENKGSKSEGTFPFLYLGNGEFVRVWLDGDISAFGNGFREFDGMRVTLVGEKNEQGVFIVTKIV